MPTPKSIPLLCFFSFSSSSSSSSFSPLLCFFLAMFFFQLTVCFSSSHAGPSLFSSSLFFLLLLCFFLLTALFFLQRFTIRFRYFFYLFIVDVHLKIISKGTLLGSMRKGFHPQNSTKLRCNFCKEVKNGGVLRIKQHLAGGYRNAKACHQCLPEVKEQMRQYFLKKNEAKDQVNSIPDFDDVMNNEDYDIDDLDDIVESNPPFKKPSSTRGSTSIAIESKPKKPRNIGPLDCYYSPEPEVVVENKKVKGRQTKIDENEPYKK